MKKALAKQVTALGNDSKAVASKLDVIDETLKHGLFDSRGVSLSNNMLNLVSMIKKTAALPLVNQSVPEERKFRTLGVRAQEFKDDVITSAKDSIANTKDFFTARGFLDKTGIAKRGSGGLLSEHLDKAEYEKKGFVGMGAPKGVDAMQARRAPSVGSEEAMQESQRTAEKTNSLLETIANNTEDTNKALDDAAKLEKDKKLEPKGTASSGILSSIGGLLKGLIPGKAVAAGAGLAGKASVGSAGLTAAKGLAIPAAIATAAGAGVDYIAGKFGAGKDEQGNDIKVDRKQDDANWKQMSFGEKLQSGLARGIEKVGSALFLGNMANQASADRIQKETAYLEKKRPKNLKPTPSVSNTLEVNISEGTFSKNDPENYQKYQAEKIKMAKEYLVKNPPRTKSTNSRLVAEKKAMFYGKNMAAQKFRKEIEAAGAGTVKGGISAQDTTPTPNTTPFDGKTMGEVTGEFGGMDPMENASVKPPEWISKLKNAASSFFGGSDAKVNKASESKDPFANNSGTLMPNGQRIRTLSDARRDAAARREGKISDTKNTESSGISWQGIKNSISSFFGGDTQGTKAKVSKDPFTNNSGTLMPNGERMRTLTDARRDAKARAAGSKQASMVYNQSAQSEDAKRAATSKDAAAQNVVTVVNNDNKSTQNTPYSLPVRKDDSAVSKYTGSRLAY